MGYRFHRPIIARVDTLCNVSYSALTRPPLMDNVSNTKGDGMGRRVRILHDGEPAWGRLEGEEVVLDGGGRVPEAEAEYLAPVEPTKILAVHLTYRSRVDEYAARTPPEPSYFVKPPTTLNGHRKVVRRPRLHVRQRRGVARFQACGQGFHVAGQGAGRVLAARARGGPR